MRLEEPYRSRALPPGTPRYFSWLFAAVPMRLPLLGIYALQAEWRALMDPGMETSVAQVKLAWWRDETRRLHAGTPTHPITRFLKSLPGITGVDLAPLADAVEAALAYVAGAPLERAVDLERYATTLLGAPLELASRVGNGADATAVRACTTALAAGEYLARTLQDYRRDARHGRVCFAVDELLAAGVEDADLLAAVPSARLQGYLDTLSARAAAQLQAAPALLPAAKRAQQRHLAVLAVLQQRQLHTVGASGALPHIRDLYVAWTTARHACSSR